MNQDQVKRLLLHLAKPAEEFDVVFTGKSSPKVDGLYRPETRELIIHNRNHHTEAQLVHTAIHEYAHHLQFCESAVPISGRAHTTRFWSIFHGLLYRAEELGLYEGPAAAHPDLGALSERIRELVARNGESVWRMRDVPR